MSENTNIAQAPADLVLQTLKNAPAPMKIGELVESTGLDKKEVDKVIKALVKDGLIASPKRCYYSAV